MLRCIPFLLFDGNCAEAMTFDISAADWMAAPAFEPKQGNTYAIFVIGGTYDELETVFDKLKEGAEEERLQELHDMPFGTYGQFYDRFGVQWIFKGDSHESR